MASNEISNISHKSKETGNTPKFIIFDLIKPFCKCSKTFGITIDVEQNDNERQLPTSSNQHVIWTTIKNYFLLTVNFGLQIASVSLITVLLQALWNTPNEKEVLDILTLLEVNVAIIIQGFICFLSMAIQVKRFGHHVDCFAKLNSLHRPCEIGLKMFVTRFIYGLFAAFVVQTGAWIAIVTTNYPNSHPILSASSNKWIILIVIDMGIISMMAYQYLYQAMYLLFVYVIGEGFQSLGSHLERAIANASLSTSHDNDAWLSRKLFKIRQRYQNSVELSLKNDWLFSPTLLTGLFSNTVVAGVVLYQMLVHLVYESKVLSGLILGVTGIVSFCWIGALCIIPHSSVTKASTCLTCLFSKRLPVNCPAAQTELKLIAIKISGPPVTITASDFVTLNRPSFTQIASVCITYIIGMLQFRQEQNT